MYYIIDRWIQTPIRWLTRYTIDTMKFATGGFFLRVTFLLLLLEVFSLIYSLLCIVRINKTRLHNTHVHLSCQVILYIVMLSIFVCVCVISLIHHCIHYWRFSANLGYRWIFHFWNIFFTHPIYVFLRGNNFDRILLENGIRKQVMKSFPIQKK
jgi:hypothetical protein